MADICQNCNCSPYQNLCVCATQNGITVIQPACQTLPDGSTASNPCFRPSPENRSYWSYKFSTDNAMATRGISSFVIPVCQNIPANTIIVSEKVDGCGTFTSVPFTISPTDPNYGPAPTGFNWLKVESNNRFDKGVTVEYRLEIVGNYPNGTQGIRVRAANVNYTFACDGCYIVPQCPAPGQLIVNKSCEEIFDGNTVRLAFQITVTNPGGSPLENVQLTDTLLFSPNITLGPITISDPSLNVDRSVPGRILITGNLGTIEPGGERVITYSLPVTAVSGPGEYLIDNRASVVSGTSQASDFCTLNLDVVQLSAAKCCTINGDQVTYRLTVTNTPNSPGTNARIVDTLMIPTGLTVRFSSFGGCQARFRTGEEVPLNQDITGQRMIDIVCDNLDIPQGGSAHRDIQLTIVSASTQSATINNTLNAVDPLGGQNQLFLPTLNVPVSVDTAYIASITCSNPCPNNINPDNGQFFTAPSTMNAASQSDCGCGGGLTSSNPTRRYNWKSEL